MHFAYAQGVIPNGKQTYLDRNGKPLANGKVYYYIPNTTTSKPTYQDINLSIPNSQPVVLDTSGRALLWGTGQYRQQVFDQNNNLIWDVTTSVGDSTGGTTATGDGDLVGTIKPWAGTIAPNQYMFAYGQTLNRVTYAALFTAITTAVNVNCVNGSPTFTGLTDTTQFWIGQDVEVSCVLTGHSTIASKTSTSVTLASNATSSQNTTATFLMWGGGDHSTTFNLPDLRGTTLVGNNSMGGTASANLTTAFFGATNPNSIGALGGAQSNTIALANLPTITSTNGSQSINVTTGAGEFFPTTVGSNWGTTTASGAAVQVPLMNAAAINRNSLSGTNSISVTSTGTTNTGFGVVQPSRTVNYIIKVTPDQNSAQASGVTSLGLMTGDIACGGGTTCTGNTISVAVTPGAGLTTSITTACSASAGSTLYVAECVNAQTGTSYAIQDSDRGKLITAANASAQAYTIAQAGTASAFQSGWYTDLCNNSTNLAGIITITPTTSTIGGTATFKIQPGGLNCIRIVSDGANYQVVNYNFGAQVPGTITNDNANAGNIGEYAETVVPVGSPVTYTTATAKDVGTLVLSAGDWDIDAVCDFITAGTTSVTATYCSISQTLNTQDITNGRTTGSTFTAVVPGAGTTFMGAVPPLRFSLSGSTTFHLVGQATFTVAGLTGYGIIRARRVR